MDSTSRIGELNRQFGIAGAAEIVEGSGGLPKVRVITEAATAEVYLHGAQVTSWRPAGAEDAIFLSSRSHWQEGRAIRGGIPICFPWFRAKADNAAAPAHGFARTGEWALKSMAGDRSSAVVELSRESDDSTRRWWPHEFRLVHRVTVGASLELELTAINTGATPFVFEEALHTYFRVGHIQSARVQGLDGVEFLDNTDANRRSRQAGDVAFAAPIDNAYLNTQGAVHLVDPALGRALRTLKDGSATTVVWNPWQQGAAGMNDLGEGEWMHFACVEASNILGSAVTLGPGASHTMRAKIAAEPI